MSVTIKTWEQRRNAHYAKNTGSTPPNENFMEDEIADLRAALAKRNFDPIIYHDLRAGVVVTKTGKIYRSENCTAWTTDAVAEILLRAGETIENAILMADESRAALKKE